MNFPGLSARMGHQGHQFPGYVMIPIVNQIHSRAGPATPQAAREAEVVGPTIARAQPEVPVVEESGAAAGDVPLGRGGIDRSQQTEAAPPRRQAVKPARAAEDMDGPQDRAVFRAKVIRFLTAIYGDDESFRRALKLGTIVIRAAEDPPDPELRPELSLAIYRHGAEQADPPAEPLPERSSGGQPQAVGATDFIAWWPK